jgi:hypothetical protein
MARVRSSTSKVDVKRNQCHNAATPGVGPQAIIAAIRRLPLILLSLLLTTGLALRA